MNDLSPLRLSALTRRVTLHGDAGEAFALWQAELTRVASAVPGFQSVEIKPAFATSPSWSISLRFRSHEALSLWQASRAWATLGAGLAAMTEPDGEGLWHETIPDPPSACVTEVITTLVQPGREEAHLAWAEKVQAAQAMFSGYMGTLVQAPLPRQIPYWTALVRFATTAQLDAWLTSPDRKALLQATSRKVSNWKSARAPDPFGAWFATQSDAPIQPPVWKQASLVLLVLFPIVMLEIRFLSPLLAAQQPAVATFIGNAVSVALTSWPAMPLAVFCARWWLNPVPRHRWPIEIAGVCALIALYAIELTTFVSLS